MNGGRAADAAARPGPVPNAVDAPRVVVLDDQLAVAQALGTLLRMTPGLTFVGYARNEGELNELLEVAEVDVLLVDLALEDADGIQVGVRAAGRWPQLSWVVLTGTADESRLAEAVRAGALGWVVKSGEPAVLVRAIHGAHRGETHIPPLMLTRLLRTVVHADGAEPIAPPAADVLDRLTPREHDVLDAMLAGRSRSDTAHWLGMAPNTVRSHTQNILRKLGVSSAAAAVALARRSARSAAD